MNHYTLMEIYTTDKEDTCEYSFVNTTPSSMEIYMTNTPLEYGGFNIYQRAGDYVPNHCSLK